MYNNKMIKTVLGETLRLEYVTLPYMDGIKTGLYNVAPLHSPVVYNRYVYSI